MDYTEILATSTQNIAEISSNIFSLERLPSEGFFEIISEQSVADFSERISTLSTRLTPLLTSLKPVSSLPINGYITTMANTLSSKAFKPLENLQFLSEIMKKQFEIVTTIRGENKELLAHIETLETDNTVTAYAKTENESLKIKLSELEDKYESQSSGWKDEKLLLQNRVIECENELQVIVDLLDTDQYQTIFNTMEDNYDEPITGSVKGVGSRIERLVLFLTERKNTLAVENEDLLMKMGNLCKDLDFKDDELVRKNRLVNNLVGEVEDVMRCGE
jgi:BMFP domain-containing protein YqiC